MYIEQFFTDCLGQSAYYIESNGEVAIIDPLRDVEGYIQLSEKRSATIKYVFETHFHADFVSGHLDLSAKTGDPVIYGPGAIANYPICVAEDGQEFELGDVCLKVLHTPGHTLESCCYLLLDENKNPHSVFSGDILFVGDVGCPDLAFENGHTAAQLAEMLFDSLESKLKPLPNYVIVYPGHGTGSTCGKSIGPEPHSTIGIQKQTNYMLKLQNKADFIKLVSENISDPPAYFFRGALFNRKGYLSLNKVIENSVLPLSVVEMKKLLLKENVLVIDTRSNSKFEKGFIPGSLNIGLDGFFEIMAGSVIDPNSKLIVVAEIGLETETITRLARIGNENVCGFLTGGFDEWIRTETDFDLVMCISATEFEDQFRYHAAVVIDVRNQNEWIPGFVAGAKLISLQHLEKSSETIDRDKIVYVYCSNGYRSMIAVSLLKSLGFQNVLNIYGGMESLRKTRISVKQLTTTTN
ncbi:MAG: MBL fold metallo-hydrolase [Bacteroidetes bacterium]|nr:MBL fold metallo-hydrolase [Bacteroidota bacterium]